jgi:DNA polymerase III epsilon subunit-like protein
MALERQRSGKFGRSLKTIYSEIFGAEKAKNKIWHGAKDDALASAELWIKFQSLDKDE